MKYPVEKEKKLCAICGKKFQNMSVLANHCRNFHDGKSEGFLKCGQMPSSPFYDNFEDHLADPSVELVPNGDKLLEYTKKHN